MQKSLFILFLLNINKKSEYYFMKSRLNKLINAFGNLPAIAEGIKNRVFTNDDVEDIAWKRWEICNLSPH